MTSEDMGDPDDGVVSFALQSAIDSWRHRIISSNPTADHEKLLELATRNLLQILEIDKTVHPLQADVSRQLVWDALYDMAVSMDIAPGTAQEVFKRAQEKRAQEVNGNGKISDHHTSEPNSDSANGRADWWREGLINVRDLCDQKFPETKYVVPGLFPEGVTLLASRPKLGKSWLLLQIGAAVANGVSTLIANDQPAHGDVLYLALEDNPKRLQRRLRKLFGDNKAAWPIRLTPVLKWKRLDQGGLEALRAWCQSVARPTLIMIDTLKKVRAPKRNNQTDYDADYEASQGLQQLAGELGIAIIVAHHDRKMEADDVFDTVSGTLGLTGGVDTIAVLKRKAGTVTLYIEGRDLIEEIEKAIKFDRETCCWVILGEAADIQRSSERARVLSALNGEHEGLSVSEIVARASLATRGAADHVLGRMAQDGEVERIKRGLYGLPGTLAKLRAKLSANLPHSKKAREIATRRKEQADLLQSDNLPHLPNNCTNIETPAPCQMREKGRSELNQLQDQDDTQSPPHLCDEGESQKPNGLPDQRAPWSSLTTGTFPGGPEGSDSHKADHAANGADPDLPALPENRWQ